MRTVRSAVVLLQISFCLALPITQHWFTDRVSQHLYHARNLIIDPQLLDDDNVRLRRCSRKRPRDGVILDEQSDGRDATDSLLQLITRACHDNASDMDDAIQTFIELVRAQDNAKKQQRLMELGEQQLEEPERAVRTIQNRVVKTRRIPRRTMLSDISDLNHDLDDAFFESLVSDLSQSKFIEEEYSDYEEYEEEYLLNDAIVNVHEQMERFQWRRPKILQWNATAPNTFAFRRKGYSPEYRFVYPRHDNFVLVDLEAWQFDDYFVVDDVQLHPLFLAADTKRQQIRTNEPRRPYPPPHKQSFDSRRTTKTVFGVRNPDNSQCRVQPQKKISAADRAREVQRRRRPRGGSTAVMDATHEEQQLFPDVLYADGSAAAYSFESEQAIATDGRRSRISQRGDEATPLFSGWGAGYEEVKHGPETSERVSVNEIKSDSDSDARDEVDWLAEKVATGYEAKSATEQRKTGQVDYESPPGDDAVVALKRSNEEVMATNGQTITDTSFDVENYHFANLFSNPSQKLTDIELPHAALSSWWVKGCDSGLSSNELVSHRNARGPRTESVDRAEDVSSLDENDIKSLHRAISLWDSILYEDADNGNASLTDFRASAHSVFARSGGSRLGAHSHDFVQRDDGGLQKAMRAESMMQTGSEFNIEEEEITRRAISGSASSPLDASSPALTTGRRDHKSLGIASVDTGPLEAANVVGDSLSKQSIRHFSWRPHAEEISPAYMEGGIEEQQEISASGVDLSTGQRHATAATGMPRGLDAKMLRDTEIVQRALSGSASSASQAGFLLGTDARTRQHDTLATRQLDSLLLSNFGDTLDDTEVVQRALSGSASSLKRAATTQNFDTELLANSATPEMRDATDEVMFALSGSASSILHTAKPSPMHAGVIEPDWQRDLPAKSPHSDENITRGASSGQAFKPALPLASPQLHTGILSTGAMLDPLADTEVTQRALSGSALSFAIAAPNQQLDTETPTSGAKLSYLDDVETVQRALSGSASNLESAVATNHQLNTEVLSSGVIMDHHDDVEIVERALSGSASSLATSQQDGVYLDENVDTEIVQRALSGSASSLAVAATSERQQLTLSTKLLQFDDMEVVQRAFSGSASSLKLAKREQEINVEPQSPLSAKSIQRDDMGASRQALFAPDSIPEHLTFPSALHTNKSVAASAISTLSRLQRPFLDADRSMHEDGWEKVIRDATGAQRKQRGDGGSLNVRPAALDERRHATIEATSQSADDNVEGASARQTSWSQYFQQQLHQASSALSKANNGSLDRSIKRDEHNDGDEMQMSPTQEGTRINEAEQTDSKSLEQALSKQTCFLDDLIQIDVFEERFSDSFDHTTEEEECDATFVQAVVEPFGTNVHKIEESGAISAAVDPHRPAVADNSIIKAASSKPQIDTPTHEQSGEVHAGRLTSAVTEKSSLSDRSILSIARADGRRKVPCKQDVDLLYIPSTTLADFNIGKICAGLNDASIIDYDKELATPQRAMASSNKVRGKPKDGDDQSLSDSKPKYADGDAYASPKEECFGDEFELMFNDITDQRYGSLHVVEDDYTRIQTRQKAKEALSLALKSNFQLMDDEWESMDDSEIDLLRTGCDWDAMENLDDFDAQNENDSMFTDFNNADDDSLLAEEAEFLVECNDLGWHAGDVEPYYASKSQQDDFSIIAADEAIRLAAGIRNDVLNSFVLQAQTSSNQLRRILNPCMPFR